MPAPSPDWTMVAVYGTYVRSNGSPVQGKVIFAPRPKRFASIGSVRTIISRPQVATLDNTGSFSIELPATDDPDISPTEFSYSVREIFGGGREFDILVPSSAAGTGINITTVAPLENSAPGEYAVPGAPGRGIVSIIDDDEDGVATITYTDDTTEDLQLPSATGLGSGVLVETLAGYPASESAAVYVGNADPAEPDGVADGSIWVSVNLTNLSPSPSGGGGGGGGGGTPLGAGVRAGPDTVGFLGDPNTLTVLNPGDSFIGTVFAGTTSYWDGDALIARGDNLVVDGYRINAALVHSSGVDMTISNSIIRAPIGMIYAVTNGGPGNGTMTISDSTISCVIPPTPPIAQAAVGTDGRLLMYRCDVHGSGDGIHTSAFPAASFAEGSILSQVYVHDVAFIDDEQHCDMIQVFISTSTYNVNNGATYITIEHSATDYTTSPTGTAVNATITCGLPDNDPNLGTGPVCRAKVDNCLLPAGAMHLRLSNNLQDCVVTNNDFGYRHVAEGEFKLSDIATATVNTITWTNNIDGTGAPYSPNATGPNAP